jgi:hypothetical protein
MNTRLEACPHCGHALSPTVGPPAPAPVASEPPPPPPPVLSYAPPYPAPPPAPSPRTGLSAASVPKILLGLGATCLLVAAVIFLAVAWSWLGIGGRTTVLVVLTITAALAGQWLARRDLGVAAEALTAVALGLLCLDLIGARHAGWLGTPTDDHAIALLGGSLLVAALGLCLPARRLLVPQLTAPVGLALLVLGLAAHTEHVLLVATATTLGYVALVELGRRLDALVLSWVSVVAALAAYTCLAGAAILDAASYPTLGGLWLDGHGYGLVAVAAMALLPWLMGRGHDDLRQLACAASAVVVTCTVAAPLVDEGATAITLGAAGSVLWWAVLSAVAPPRWYAVPRVPLLGSLLALAPVPLGLAVTALGNLVTVAAPFSADATVRLDPATTLGDPLLLPLAVGVALVAAALTVGRAPAFVLTATAAIAATALLSAALLPLPLWLFVAVLGPFGLLVAAPSAVLTMLVLAEIVVLAVAILLRRSGTAAAIAGAVLPAATAGLVWVSGHVVGAPSEQLSLVTLVVLGLLALLLPRVEVELVAAASVLVAATSGVAAADDATVSLAVHLTLAGAFVTATALLHRDRRSLAWLGGLLLASATWVRLLDLGVHAPEAYTLPTALALVLVGCDRLRRVPGTPTVTALLPGLALATVPSLLWALEDPLSPRAVLLGLACLVLLLGGTALEWTAPVLVGGAVGGLLVLRELAPYAAVTPQWALIGAAGTLLIGVGVTWEARLRDLRQAASYLDRLR